jgi:hypothetical protein
LRSLYEYQTTFSSLQHDAGLHDVVENAMNIFHEASDIVIMGQELLHGTGWEN